MQSNTLNWRFDHSYAQLPSHFYEKCRPLAVPDPQVVLVNHPLAHQLGLSLDADSDSALASVFSGNQLPPQAEPLAMAYAGHQFGHLSLLGDGRAHLLGEHLTPENKRFDIQLKGSGPTPYARRGDGRAALGPMLREYIISEAMAALGIPSTRSLAVVRTGDSIRRHGVLPGAILTRVAASHLRIGTFQYCAAKQDKNDLIQLADYTIQRHYPDIAQADKPYIELLKSVVLSQVHLVVEWLRVGFIHGVMNTDNIALSGETIDYGPCAFMDHYDPKTVFSSIDTNGRYAYANQAPIMQWNLARFAEALLPLIDNAPKKSVTIAEDIIRSFQDHFEAQWLDMMRRKLGLWGEADDDGPLIQSWMQWLHQNQIDFTNGFRYLSHCLSHDHADLDPLFAQIPQQDTTFKQWFKQWQQRLHSGKQSPEQILQGMNACNPVVIPRNHVVEDALNRAEQSLDYGAVQTLLDALSQPYEQTTENEYLRPTPEKNNRIYQTFCGT